MEIMIKLTAVSASLVRPSFFKYLDSNWVILSLKSNKAIYLWTVVLLYYNNIQCPRKSFKMRKEMEIVIKLTEASVFIVKNSTSCKVSLHKSNSCHGESLPVAWDSQDPCLHCMGTLLYHIQKWKVLGSRYLLGMNNIHCRFSLVTCMWLYQQMYHTASTMVKSSRS